MEAFGWGRGPITLEHIERWSNPDGTITAASQGHDDSELSAKETLLQFQRVANTVVPDSNPACLGRALLAAEAQQKALDVVWPQYQKTGAEEGGWNTRMRVGLGSLGRMHWWIRTLNDDYVNGDTELKAAQKAMVTDLLVPFIANWHADSRAHPMSSALCKNCAK
ncbi:hypothetical protein F5Y03DRAFT_137835 [Xylaria venustula]|nr:hypothetical protein F5Y03DRAFT_137835 [Xylaria venustula]